MLNVNEGMVSFLNATVPEPLTLQRMIEVYLQMSCYLLPTNPVPGLGTKQLPIK